MNQDDSMNIEYNVFDRQESISDGSTNYSNNNEALIVVWLRSASTTIDAIFGSISSKIENSADRLKNFVDLPEKCEEYIRNTSKNVKIFLILSSRYAPTFLDNIHDVQLLHSIYIHDETSNDFELKNYPKVVNVYTDLNLLTEKLSSVIYTYIRYAQVSITIFKQQNELDRTASLLNKFAYFVDFWNPLFFDLLLELPQIDYEQQKMNFIKQCRICYRADDDTLKDIGEFEKDYHPELSIEWYKRDAFVYRLLNKVMRQQNIEGILTFRFFILDLFEQLNKLYHGFIDIDVYEDDLYFSVYRGQIMFSNELNDLKKDLTHGTIISINSFFSTSHDRNIALGFSSGIKTADSILTVSPNMKHVLFEIKITINLEMQLKRIPFADVSFILKNGVRDKPHEEEVLFMVGSFFQVDDIVEDVEYETLYEGNPVKVTVAVVKLTLINENDVEIPIMKDYQILKSTKTIEGKLIRIGNLLIDHSLSIQSPRSKADIYYTAMLNEFKLMMTAACLTGQAWMGLKRKQYDAAIRLALKALSIHDKPNDEIKVTALNCLGAVYTKRQDYPKALKYYMKAYDLSKPTDDKIASNSYSGPCIPIDKFAMYDNYRNISSINIACIHQTRGDIQQAWNMYKEAVDYEMRDTTDFHCHTCMTIAESGLHELTITPEEQNRLWKNWKSFLDLGMTDMLKYRTPVITGYLSLSHQYDFPSRRFDNSYCRIMAIDYFRKVEKQCLPYVSNHQYYLYTLQCYEHLAVLYQQQGHRSIDCYEKMIQLCLKYHPDDLENIISGYKGMIKTYKLQQLKGPDSSEDIFMKLCTDNNDTGVSAAEIPRTPPIPLTTPPITPFIAPIFGILFQNIKPLHFAFDCYEKWIDPRLEHESDLRKKIIYCHMKLAALYYNQKKVDVAQQSLVEAILLCRPFGSEMAEVIKICNENLLFTKENFDVIIQWFKSRLPTNTDIDGNCCDENNYCYIAQLYEKKNDLDSALEFLQKPLRYFEEYNYVCSHTIDCYIKLAKHYQTIKHDQESTVRTYERALYLVKRHRLYPMTTLISIVKDHLINYFKEQNDLETTIIIYQTLCTIVQQEATDITILYNHFKRILKLLVRKHDALNVILNTYNVFLNLILQIINPLTSQITMVLFHFRNYFIEACKEFNEIPLAIEIYQKLICLLFTHQNDTMKMINEYRFIAAEFATKHLLEASVRAHEKLLVFVCQHHSTGGFIECDLIRFIFFVWKDQIIKQYLMERNFDRAVNLYYKMIHFLEKYRTDTNAHYDLNDFISRTLQNYDGIMAIYQLKIHNLDEMMNIYQKQIDFLAKYEAQTVHERMKTIVLKCKQFAADHKEQAIELYSKLVVFIGKNRLSYLSDLSTAYKELARLDPADDKLQQYLYSTNERTTTSCSYQVADLNQCIFDYKQKAKQYLDKKQLDKAIRVYRNELLPFLLENHTRIDEQVAVCYRQIASLYYEQNKNNAEQALQSYQKAIDIYLTQKDDFYTEYAFELNPNVCRRYAETLFKCYNCMAAIYTALENKNLVELYKQKAIDIYETYKDQFQFIANPVTNIITVEIRPFVELNY